MAVTIVVGSSTADRLIVGPSPLAELGAVLHALSGPDHHPMRELLDRLRTGLSAPSRRELTRLSPLWSGYRARFLYPDEAGPGRSFAEEVEALRRRPLISFLESAAWVVQGGYSGGPRGTELVGGGPSCAEVLARARARGPEAEALAVRLFDDPEVLRSHVVDVIADVFDHCFRTEWQRMEPIVARDARNRTELAQRSGPVTALASLTTAGQLLMNPLRFRIDKLHSAEVRLDTTVTVLVPSVVGWPHLTVKNEPGWPPVIQYPVWDNPNGHVKQTSLSDMLRSIRVLTDPARLNLCRFVAREAATTTDLAARTGMTVPQASRHLRHLREAGLVHTYREGRVVFYRLNLDGIRSLGPDLIGALLR